MPNHMHLLVFTKNPLKVINNIVGENYTDYVHSSAGFYDLGKEGIYKVYHYEDVLNDEKSDPQGFRNQI